MQTIEQYILGKIAEEAAEVAQIALKCQQFGLSEVYTDQAKELSNAQRLLGELYDLATVVNMLHDLDADYDDFKVHEERKRAKVAYYLKYAQSLGQVQEE